MFGLIFWEFYEIFKIGFLVHQLLSSCCYFCFLFPSTALKFWFYREFGYWVQFIILKFKLLGSSVDA